MAHVGAKAGFLTPPRCRGSQDPNSRSGRGSPATPARLLTRPACPATSAAIRRHQPRSAAGDPPPSAAGDPPLAARLGLPLRFVAWVRSTL